MDIPTTEFRAFGPVHDNLEAVPSDASEVCAYGRAKNLARLGSLPRLRRLWLSGMVENAWSAARGLCDLRELVVHDFRASSFTVMPEFPALEVLAIAGSSKLRSLEGIQRYEQIRTLLLFGCCNYRDLSPLRALRGLVTLCLEGGFSKTLRVDSFEPLAGLVHLRRLRLASIRVTDRSLRPLSALRRLESVFVAQTFAPSELRHLAEALPEARGEFLDSARSRKPGSRSSG